MTSAALVAPLITLVVAWVFVAYCLSDLAHAREVRYLDRWPWAVIIIRSPSEAPPT